MTNREIAQALFITIRTVTTHLGHAYEKRASPGAKGSPRSSRARELSAVKDRRGSTMRPGDPARIIAPCF
jgi:hypothetical protein